MMRNHHRGGPKYLQRTHARYIHYHILCENNNPHGIYCKNALAYTRGIQSIVIPVAYTLSGVSITQNTRRNYADENPSVIITPVIISYR